MARFGPILRKEADGSRKIMEHIISVGRYFWSAKQTNLLLSKLRSKVLVIVHQRYPMWQNLDQDQLCEAIAEKLSLPVVDVQEAMGINKGLSKEEVFHKAVRTLKNIKETL
jgi:hypothetical protein